MSTVIQQIQDFRTRVLKADALRREGKAEEAARLMPDRKELIEAVKAYRQGIGQKAPSRAAGAASKTQAAAVAKMDAKDLLG